MKTLRLGLIGTNITQSRSPALHICFGLSTGRNVSYDLLIPEQLGLSFSETITRCRNTGYDGLNISYPFKEEVLKQVAPGTSVVAAMGAANTIHFTTNGATAWNTDHSGFIAAYRARWGTASPGRVLIIGAGGVGRAIAFALAELAAESITLFDTDQKRSAALASAVQKHTPCSINHVSNFPSLAGFDGIVNCTPIGMVGVDGSPLPEGISGRIRWGFDAVYTPAYTTFASQVEKMGAEFLSGYELYFHQGVDCFQIWSDTKISHPDWVRTMLAGTAPLVISSPAEFGEGDFGSAP